MAQRRKTEKDYLAIAKQKVSRPATKVHFPKMLVYSRNKKGKTTFSLSGGIPQTIVLDPEKGTELMKHKNPYVWNVSRWEDVQEFWGALRTMKLSPKELGQGPEKEPFKFVSCDGLTRLNKFALRYVRHLEETRDVDRIPGLTKRQDYFKSNELMADFINNLFSLRMGVIFTAQERIITDGNGDDDLEQDDAARYYVPDIPAGVRATVNQVVDVIARLYVVTVETKAGPKKQRRLQIGIHDSYDTGFRSDFILPDVMKNPTVPKLVKLMETGEAV